MHESFGEDKSRHGHIFSSSNQLWPLGWWHFIIIVLQVNLLLELMNKFDLVFTSKRHLCLWFHQCNQSLSNIVVYFVCWSYHKFGLNMFNEYHSLLDCVHDNIIMQWVQLFKSFVEYFIFYFKTLLHENVVKGAKGTKVKVLFQGLQWHVSFLC